MLNSKFKAIYTFNASGRKLFIFFKLYSLASISYSEISKK